MPWKSSEMEGKLPFYPKKLIKFRPEKRFYQRIESTRYRDMYGQYENLCRGETLFH